MKYCFGILLLFFLYEIYENALIKVKHIEIRSNKIKKNYTFVHLCDLHNNPWICKKYLLKTIRRQNSQGVFFTGDMVSYDHTDFSKIKYLTEHLSIPMYFVLGNHECGNLQLQKLENLLVENKVKVLKKEELSLAEDLELFGLSYSLRKDFSVDAKKFNLLLLHDPMEYVYNMKPQMDLVLCGHTHGGQLRLPRVGAIAGRSKNWYPKYTEGLIFLSQGILYINSGLGSKKFFRLCNRVSFTVVHILKEE